MLTTLLNPTLWLLAALAGSALLAQANREDGRTAFARVVRIGTSRALLLILALAAAGSLGSRVVLGYLAPGAYAEEVIGARSYLAERQVYHGNDRADFSRWLSEEPAAADPWTLPGLTVCQASALERRPQFYTSQGHSPVLLLASVPVVRVAGGRALYVTMVALSLVAVAGIVGALALDLGLAFSSTASILLAIAIAGWQPVLAGIRQGDAVLIVAGLTVWSSRLLRSRRATGAGIAAGVSSVLLAPATVLLIPVAKASTRALVVGIAVMASVVAAAAALGGVMLLVDYATSTLAGARLYASAPITYSAVAKVLALSASPAPAVWLAAAAVVLTGLAAWRRPTQAFDVSFASFAALAFLLTPIAWSQHVTLLVLPLVALLTHAVTSRRPGLLLFWTAIALLLSLPDPPNLWLDVGIRAGVGAGMASTLPTVPIVAATLLWVSMLRL
jgi:hypothetical protein